MKQYTLLYAVTSVVTGNSKLLYRPERTVQATVEGTGALTATVLVEVSNDKRGWVELGTIALTGTDLATDGIASIAPWSYVRASVTEVSGTGANVTVTGSS